MRVAVIPARGGSKRIPRKNIRMFCGKPMICWPILAAQDSGLFDKIIVSSDDSEIIEVARQVGAEAPFVRPRELSDDLTPTRPVVNHAINELEKTCGRLEEVCVIYATASFLRASDLLLAFDQLNENCCDYVFSVALYDYPIQRALRITDGGVEMFSPEYRLTRSQDLEEAYHDAGQFYLGRRDAFINDVPTFSNHSLPFLLPSYRALDIDTEEDWRRAELMGKELLCNNL